MQLYQNKGTFALLPPSEPGFVFWVLLFFFFLLGKAPLIQQKQEEDNEEKEQSKGSRRGEWVGADRVKPNRIKCNLA